MLLCSPRVPAGCLLLSEIRAFTKAERGVWFASCQHPVHGAILLAIMVNDAGGCEEEGSGQVGEHACLQDNPREGPHNPTVLLTLLH